MFLVAITRLAATPDAQVTLAADLGTTLYELRLGLAAGLPAVVLVTPEEGRATAAADAVRRQGYESIVCHRRSVLMSAQMTMPRAFQLGPTALEASAGAKGTLPYDDLSALLRATHGVTTASTTEVKERKLRPVMAIATGGLVLSKTTKREVRSQTLHQEQVLYLFRQSGAVPWILRERALNYAGLGADLRPTSIENFGTLTRRLRELAPRAVYDERLLRSRPIRGVAQGVEATDILAHLVAIEAAACACAYRAPR